MVNINGVWRDNSIQFVNIDNVWRRTGESVNINGVWRTVEPLTQLTEEDIQYFEMIYVLDRHISSNGLRYNPLLSEEATFASSSREIDFDSKSIIMHYDNSPSEVFGTYRYRGYLYARAKDKYLIDIGNIYDITNINITIKIELTTINDGDRDFTGWNQAFNDNNCLAKANMSNNISTVEHLILPVTKRDNRYIPYTIIGISRDEHVDVHMNSAMGYADQTIHGIYVNSSPYPFTIKIRE